MHLADLMYLDPISEFVIIMFLMLILPRFFERMHLPGLIGLLLSGFVLGPMALGILDADRDVLRFLSTVGKLMVMFFAGLEIDFEHFVRHWKRSLTFGFFTFFVPLTTGFAIAVSVGFPFVSAMVVGSLLASHTLVGFVIIKQWGLVQQRAVSCSIGATIFTDIASLMVLAGCVTFFTTGFDFVSLGIRMLEMLVYFPAVLFGGRYLAPKLLAHMEDNEDHRTLLMILIMGMAAVGAELIHLEGIIGAFTAGLAVGGVLRNGPTKEKLETLGNTLFIPMFFLMIGTLIDPMSFVQMDILDLVFAVSIVAGLIGAKAVAAYLSSRILRFSRVEAATMWSLSIPQVAATLAAALVAYETVNESGDRLISYVILDTALLLMVVTTILGPILTDKYIRRLSA